MSIGLYDIYLKKLLAESGKKCVRKYAVGNIRENIPVHVTNHLIMTC